MTTSIAITDQPTAGKFCCLIARATYDPIPGRVIVVSPTDIASEATTKNQPPDIDIIVFQTRPGIEKGTSSRQKRCQPEKRKLSDASSRSCGSVFSDW